MGEHLLKGGWPLSRALRVDAEMPKRPISEMEPIVHRPVQHVHFLGSDTLVPARCVRWLTPGDLAHCCGLGGPGLSLDIRHCR